MLNESQIDIITGYYDNAKEKKELTDYCFNTGKYKLGIPNLYYYIFNLCRAIIATEYEDTSKHKTLLGNFNKTMIHERKVFDRSYGSLLSTLEKQRGLCDYEPNYKMDKEFALYLYEQGMLFGEELQNYINKEYLQPSYNKAQTTHKINKQYER